MSNWWDGGFDNEARVAEEIAALFTSPVSGVPPPTNLDLEHRIRALTDPIRQEVWRLRREKAALLLAVELLEEKLP